MADGLDEAGGGLVCGLGVGGIGGGWGLADGGEEGVDFVLDVGVCNGPVVLGGGGVEESGEDEFVEDVLACGFGEEGPEVGGGDGVVVDEGDDCCGLGGGNGGALEWLG